MVAQLIKVDIEGEEDEDDNERGASTVLEESNDDSQTTVCMLVDDEAEFQNSKLGRKKKHVTYCTAALDGRVGCNNEMPALQGHGNGGVEKTARCNNPSCRGTI